jgi:TldD protein
MIDDSNQIQLEATDLDFLRDLAKKYQIQYFNSRFAIGQSNSFSILKGVSRNSSTSIGKSFSIQAFKEGGYGFASGINFNQDELTNVFIQAAKLADWVASRAKEKFEIKIPQQKNTLFKIPQKIRLSSIDPDEKMRTLLELEHEAISLDPRIISTQVNYRDIEAEKVYFNSEGQLIRLQTANSHVLLQAVAKEGPQQQGYMASDGNTGGYEMLQNAHGLGTKAAEQALELLRAKPVKADKYNIIMDPLLTGTFIHEAFGHACEADGVLAGESILAGKVGQTVGNSVISVIDDGTIKNAYGWTPFDDEGMVGHRTQLVKDGILMGYLHSLETASKMGVSPTGNARSNSIGNPPIVRMTNTYLSPGDMKLEELIHELKNGLLCVSWVYGYVEPADGSFMFKMKKAYQVENGEKTQIYRDAAISGLTLDVLNRITGISRDLEMDVGTCGKGGQDAPVTSGGPYTMIKDMVIGGQ